MESAPRPPELPSCLPERRSRRIAEMTRSIVGGRWGNSYNPIRRMGPHLRIPPIRRHPDAALGEGGSGTRDSPSGGVLNVVLGRWGWQARPNEFVRGTRWAPVTGQSGGGGRSGSVGASPSRGVLNVVLGRWGWQARRNQFVGGTRGAPVTRQSGGGGRSGSAGASPSRGVLNVALGRWGWQARPNQFVRGTRGRSSSVRAAGGRRG